MKFYRNLAVLFFAGTLFLVFTPTANAETVLWDNVTGAGFGGDGGDVCSGGVCNDLETGEIDYGRLKKGISGTVNRLRIPINNNNSPTNTGFLSMKVYLSNDAWEKVDLLGESNLVDASSICENAICGTDDDEDFLLNFDFPAGIPFSSGDSYYFTINKYNLDGGGRPVYWCQTASNDNNQSCKGGSNKRMKLIIIEGAAVAPYTLLSEDIISTTTLPAKVFVISGDVTIDPGVTVNIENGAVIKFDTSTTSSLTVNGTLDSLGDEFTFGTTPSHIIFTSLNDDVRHNDNGTTTIASPGDWAGITVNPGGIANFTGTIIRYGGSVNSSNAMIFNNGGTIYMSTSTVVYGSGYGIRSSSGTTTILNSDIAYNTHGLYVSGGTASISATSTIHDNSSYGVYNSSGYSMNAENNFWGGNSGPYHTSNPTGAGNQVSDDIDFSPWIGTSTLHYVSGGCPLSFCGSVTNGGILLDASTTNYIFDLSAATSTWHAVGGMRIEATSSQANVDVFDVDVSDVVLVGSWHSNDTQPDSLVLNSYFMDVMNHARRQNVIIHELGHALGLEHSYIGNILYYSVTSQIILGSQDIDDYNYLW